MGWIAVLVKKTCTLLAVICVAACFAQAASAFDLNNITPAPAKLAETRLGRVLFPQQFGRVRSVDGAGALHGLCSTRDPRSPTAKISGDNFQSGNVVFGLEGSFAAANFDGKFTAPYLPATSAGGWTPNMNWLGTVTGRVGYSVGQWLPYVKGGFAAADVGSPLQGAVRSALSRRVRPRPVGLPASASNISFRPNCRSASNTSTPTWAPVRQAAAGVVRRRRHVRFAGDVFDRAQEPEPAGPAQL